MEDLQYVISVLSIKYNQRLCGNWHTDRYTDQWNTNHRNRPHVHGQVNFNKGTTAGEWREDNHFNKWCWIWEKMDIKPNLTPYTKINSKWILDLNIKAKMIKILGENLCDLGRQSFLRTQKSIKEKH